jgi:phospholipase C
VPIDHVVVLALENRSFDHMLGFLQHPDKRFEGLSGTGPFDNPGWENGPRVAVSADARQVLPFGPDHSHNAVMDQLGATGVGANRKTTGQGFLQSYERKARGLAQVKFGGILAPVLGRLLGNKKGPVAEGRGPLVMLCQSPGNVPVLSKLALEFAVCDHWFCSVPGETWPNRNYLHAATSDGETDIELRPYTDRTIFELLEDNDKRWRIYHDDTPQVWAFRELWDTPERHGNWFPVAKFAVHAKEGNLATYSFIEPNHKPPFHTVDVDPSSPGLSNSQHPENNIIPNGKYDTYDGTADTDFKRGEALIATVYEALRANPELFARTMFVITYDEHGGLYDHVAPPTDAPSPGDSKSFLAKLLHAIWHRQVRPFDFTMLGPRVPAVIVSPLIPAGTLDSRVHDHASVPSTLRVLFAPDAKPLTARDEWSLPFHDVATLDEPRTDLPDLSAFKQTTAMGLPPTVTAAATVAEPAPATKQEIPDYYRDFLKQAEQVRQHLDTVGEPEVEPTAAMRPGAELGAEVTLAFAKAAHRHRHDPAVPTSGTPSTQAAAPPR